MKKLLTSLMAVMLVLLAVSPSVFAEVPPNWYWLHSDDILNVYVDTNSMSTYKDPSTNITYKKVTNILTSCVDPITGQLVNEFKTENGINYHRMISGTKYDANQKLIEEFSFSKHPDGQWRKDSANDEIITKTLALFK